MPYIPSRTDVAAYVRGQVIESAANTFTQQEIDTQLDPRTSQNILLITGMIVHLGGAPSAGPDAIRWQLTRTTQTAMIAPNNRDYIIGGDDIMIVSTNGGALFQRVPVIELPIPHAIAGNLFLAVEGASLAAAVTVSACICGYIKKATAQELLRVSL